MDCVVAVLFLERGEIGIRRQRSNLKYVVYLVNCGGLAALLNRDRPSGQRAEAGKAVRWWPIWKKSHTPTSGGVTLGGNVATFS